MRYIYTLEEKKFKEEKEKENALLRSFGVDEKTIQSIYDYDWEMFKKNRAFHRNEVYLDETFFDRRSSNVTWFIYNPITFESTVDIEYGLQQLYPCYVVAAIDNETLNALLLRINGYTIAQIAEKMDLKDHQVDYMFRRLKNYLKKFTKFD